jgi:hypothetical protein
VRTFREISEAHLAHQLNAEQHALSVTVRPISGASNFNIMAVLDQLVGAANERNEMNFHTSIAEYPSPTEGDVIEVPEEGNRRYVVTKSTIDGLGGVRVQAFAPVVKN